MHAVHMTQSQQGIVVLIKLLQLHKTYHTMTMLGKPGQHQLPHICSHLCACAPAVLRKADTDRRSQFYLACPDTCVTEGRSRSEAALQRAPG